jgi:hypothetical protein
MVSVPKVSSNFLISLISVKRVPPNDSSSFGMLGFVGFDLAELGPDFVGVDPKERRFAVGKVCVGEMIRCLINRTKVR